jgi:hypothetical protein
MGYPKTVAWSGASELVSNGVSAAAFDTVTIRKLAPPPAIG